MIKKIIIIIIILVCIAGVLWFVRKHTGLRGLAPKAVATTSTTLSNLPHFAPLNAGRMGRSAQRTPSKCGWGTLTVYVNGAPTEFKDVKIWVGHKDAQVKTWDWGLTNTRHVPGIQIADLQEFIDQVDEVILTRGVESVLQVPQETIDYVQSQGKICHVGTTPEMVELYNQLVDAGKKVGGVFHSTC